MFWLSTVCFLLAMIAVLLAVKIVLMKKDINAMGKEFAEKLTGDTNTSITVSSLDKSVRRLARDINTQLKVLRAQCLRYRQGDTELKNAVANISHDLRTPLTAICGYLDLLENEEKSGDAERYIGYIKDRTEILKQLSEELFRYSVIASPDYDLPQEKVCINRVLEESIAGCYADLRQANITPEITMAETNVYCMANGVALSRIFSNIITNAVKYGDGDLKITLSSSGELVFSNSASYLTAIQANRLFDRFYTVENAKKSTGLGLSIAKALVERIGGTIAAAYGNGRLEIIISLPVIHI